MLEIRIPRTELFNNKTQEFVYLEEETLQLEHSLLSLSKWEAKWCKPFLSGQQKTNEEILDYIACMALTPDVSPNTYRRLSEENVNEINRYICAPMTATTFFNDKRGSSSREKITSELIYYWMIALNIPFECQEWHLNRLLTLIRVCNVKNQPPKKHSKKEIMSRNAALNAARRKQYNTRG